MTEWLKNREKLGHHIQHENVHDVQIVCIDENGSQVDPTIPGNTPLFYVKYVRNHTVYGCLTDGTDRWFFGLHQSEFHDMSQIHIMEYNADIPHHNISPDVDQVRKAIEKVHSQLEIA